MKLACIVEGHGEVEAVPVLLERILYSATDSDAAHVEVLRPPHRVPKGKMKSFDELERALRFQWNRTGPDGAILVLLDADDDCHVELAAGLRERMHARLSHVRASVVVAIREYEAWLVASEAGEVVPDPQSLANPKAWLEQRFGHYSETVDQPRLSARLDIDRASKLRSFRKLVKELGVLVGRDMTKAASVEPKEDET